MNENEKNSCKYEHSEEFQKKILNEMSLYSYSPIRENRRFNALLEDFDIPYQTYRVLALLLDYPDGIEPSKIAGIFSILRQTVTNIADAMEKCGYIERVRSESDRRSIRLRLLPAGVEATKAMNEEIISYHKRVMTNFSDSELEAYFKFRKKLMEKLDDELEKTLKNKKKAK